LPEALIIHSDKRDCSVQRSQAYHLRGKRHNVRKQVLAMSWVDCLDSVLQWLLAMSGHSVLAEGGANGIYTF
jgi:hypothetical protein